MSEQAGDDDRPVWRALDMPLERLDELPFGAIVVDATGRVHEYNEYESRLSHLEKERVLGRNFFIDVAPCTAVREFEGRMREFARSREKVSETFDYFFPFRHGAATVRITFVRLPMRDRYLIAVERREPATA